MENQETTQPKKAGIATVATTAMLGLFRYSYDYYEWENIICVSTDREKLKQEYEKNEDSSRYPLIKDDIEHEYLSDAERQHFAISEVEQV